MVAATLWLQECVSFSLAKLLIPGLREAWSGHTQGTDCGAQRPWGGARLGAQFGVHTCSGAPITGMDHLSQIVFSSASIEFAHSLLNNSSCSRYWVLSSHHLIMHPASVSSPIIC